MCLFPDRTPYFQLSKFSCFIVAGVSSNHCIKYIMNLFVPQWAVRDSSRLQKYRDYPHFMERDFSRLRVNRSGSSFYGLTYLMI